MIHRVLQVLFVASLVGCATIPSAPPRRTIVAGPGGNTTALLGNANYTLPPLLDLSVADSDTNAITNIELVDKATSCKTDLYLVLTGDINAHRQAAMQLEKVSLGPVRQHQPGAISEGARQEIAVIGAKGTQYPNTIKFPNGETIIISVNDCFSQEQLIGMVWASVCKDPQLMKKHTSRMIQLLNSRRTL